MFSAEYVIVALTTGMVVGAVIATVAIRVLVIDPLMRDLKAANRRTRRAVSLSRQHHGTPYRPETVAMHQHRGGYQPTAHGPAPTQPPTPKGPPAPLPRRAPGLRLVDGEPMYSSEWLNELRTVETT